MPLKHPANASPINNSSYHTTKYGSQMIKIAKILTEENNSACTTANNRII